MKKKLLQKGDVIKTNPREGFWGCAVVISEREKTKERDPMCHIAITQVVFQHDYDFSELDTSKLKVMDFIRQYRLKPDEEFSKKETLIGVYSRKIKIPINIIGNINTEHIYSGPLPFEPYYNLKVTFPLYGNITRNFGSEAIISWRRINDKDALDKEMIEADKKHDTLIAKIKEKEREKRNNTRVSNKQKSSSK
jgi:hypothetical protein